MNCKQMVIKLENRLHSINSLRIHIAHSIDGTAKAAIFSDATVPKS